MPMPPRATSERMSYSPNVATAATFPASGAASWTESQLPDLRLELSSAASPARATARREPLRPAGGGDAARGGASLALVLGRHAAGARVLELRELRGRELHELARLDRRRGALGREALRHVDGRGATAPGLEGELALAALEAAA